MPEPAEHSRSAPKTIFIAVYRAFSVRYILESGIFAELRRSPHRVVILHPDHDSEYIKAHFAGGNVVLEPFPWEEGKRLVKGSTAGAFLKQVRYCAYAGQQEDSVGTRKIFEAYHFQGLKGRIVKVCARLCRASLMFRKAVLALESILLPGREAQPLFDKYKPDLLVVSSIGYALDCPLMRQARRNGCKVLSIVHSWDNPSTKGYRGATPDYVVAWNHIMKEEIRRYHDVAPGSIFVGGIAHWDSYFDEKARCPRGEFLARHGVAADAKVIFYAPSGPKHIFTTLDQVEFLLQKIRAGTFGKCHLIMRLHPASVVGEKGKWERRLQADLDHVDRLAKEFSGLVTFNRPEVVHLGREFVYPMADMLVYADVLKHSDVMVTEYSTCMIEACIFDLPVVNVAYQKWRDTGLKTSETLNNLDHLRRIFATGAVRHANSQEELVALIEGYFANRGLDAGERRKVVDQECPVNRGTAGRRIADHILGLLGRGH